MSNFSTKHNRVVWFDLPVVDLERSAIFYRNVLAIEVSIEKFDNLEFAVLAHTEGNGGCLVPGKKEGVVEEGLLIYLNVEGRIDDAVAQVESSGGKVLEDTHAIGPHGFRAIIHDSEGNRLALHSETR